MTESAVSKERKIEELKQTSEGVIEEEDAFFQGTPRARMLREKILRITGVPTPLGYKAQDNHTTRLVTTIREVRGGRSVYCFLAQS